MTSNQVQVTDDEIEQMIRELGLTPTGVRGVSKTVVSAAHGAKPKGTNLTVAVLIGDGSLSMEKHRSIFVGGYNEYYLLSMRESADPGHILVGTSFFTDENYDDDKAGEPDYQEPLRLWHAPVPLEDAQALDESLYDPKTWNSNTPLNDAIISGIRAAIAYAETMAISGKTVKIIIIFFSDGQENVSINPMSAVKNDIKRLLELRNYIPVFVGFGRDASDVAYFKNYAKQAGFPAGNVKAVAASTDEDARRELRQLFQELSQRSVGVSQGSIGDDEFFS